MGNDHRLERLRELLARIEQLPVTAESERMLREVRARVVDVDTGMAPSAMLPVDPAPPLASDPRSQAVYAPKAVARLRAEHDVVRPAAPAPERRRSVEAARPDAGSRSGAGLSAAQDREWLALVAKNEVLSLDGSAPLPSAGDARSGHDSRPWTRGLRG